MIEQLMTLAKTTGENTRNEKSRRKISRANMTPAIGALKMADIPAATPHATSTLMFFRSIRRNCPTLLPIAAPI